MRANKQQTKADGPRRSKAQRLTVAQLADAVGISDRVLQKHFARGCPRGPVAAIRKWRADNISVSRRRTASEEHDPARIALENRKLRLDVRFRKIQNSELARQFVRRSTVELATSELRKKVNVRLSRIPAELDLEALPKRIAHEIRREIADRIRLITKELDDFEI